MAAETKKLTPPVPKPVTRHDPEPILSIPILTNYCHNIHSYPINRRAVEPEVMKLLTPKHTTQCDT
jgi:hypothetical protein